MFDANGMFESAVAVTADAFCTTAVAINKTPAEGLLVEVVVTAVDNTTGTLAVKAYSQAADSAWATTADVVGEHKSSITAVGRYFFRIFSKKKYVKLYWDVGGTSPGFTITAGIATGGQRDMVA